MIAGRRGDDATRPLLDTELCHGIARAAQLEAAGDLLGFKLEVHRHAQPPGQAGRMLHGRTPDQCCDALAGEVNIVEL
ncbi:hypothetical protein D3C75_1213940 [compost metagenome]